jgi:predicted transcriptional regulator
MASTTLGIKLDEKTRQRLKQLAELKDRSPHWIMKTAIGEYLDREEAEERQQAEDRARWERYVETGAFIDNDEMMSWLDGLAVKARTKTSRR